MYTGAGYAASGLHDISGGRVGSKDYAEFLWAAGNPHYVEKSFSEPAGDTQEKRATQSAEANRYTKRAVNEIAPKVETSAVTLAQGVATVTSAGLLGATTVERVTDQLLMAQGEAPTRSLIKMYSPIGEKSDFGTAGNFVVDTVLGVRSDDHYKYDTKGGLPDAHPASQYNPANHPAPPPPPPPSTWENIASTAKGFFGSMTEKMGLGMSGMLAAIGGLVGVALLFFNPIVGISVLLASLASHVAFGQQPANQPAQPQQTTVASTTPQRDNAHSNDIATNLTPSFTPTAGKQATNNLGRV